MGRKSDYATGSGSINPFDPPRQMAAHAASIVVLLELIQRKRKEPQYAVEVGCWQSQTSRWLLTAMPYLNLAMVDPLECGGEGTHWNDSFSGAPPEQMRKNIELVEKTVADFAPRAIWHRELSVDGASHFKDGSQDTVFIDAGHQYLNVRDDIAAWRSKVRPGGWLSGHDYRPTGMYGNNVGRAVREFIHDSGLPLTVWPGKTWAVRIRPYDRHLPICPSCKFEQQHDLKAVELVLDHFVRSCASCGRHFSYAYHPSCEFHCWI